MTGRIAMAAIKGKKLKANELADVIRTEIIAGKLRSGDRLEPVRTLAKSFGVGRGIAYTAVETLKNEGFLVSRGRSGIYVERTGEPSDSTKRRRIGFYVKSGFVTEDEYAMFHALSACGLMTGCDVIIGYENASVILEQWSSGLDGILVTGYVDDALVVRLKSMGLPFIVIGNYELKEECNTVRFDIRRAIREVVTDAYSRLKFERLGMFLHSPDLYAVREAIEAVREVRKKCGFSFSQDDILFDPDEDGYKAMKMIMMRPADKRPQAIMLSYQSIFGAARYIYECNLKSIDRPVLIGKIQENFARLMPGLPDVRICDDSYASFARETMVWVMSLIEAQQAFSGYETRVHLSPWTLVFS